MVSKRALQGFCVLLIVVVVVLAFGIASVAAQGPNWGGGGLIVSGFGNLFGVILRFFALIFGF